jgi:transcriptional regulator with XRE-family HTH domain
MKNTALKTTIAQTIKQFREKKSLSQEQLAFESDLHRTYISLLERGKRNPTLEALFAIATALDTKPSKLIRHIENRLTQR